MTVSCFPVVNFDHRSWTRDRGRIAKLPLRKVNNLSADAAAVSSNLKSGRLRMTAQYMRGTGLLENHWRIGCHRDEQSGFEEHRSLETD